MYALFELDEATQEIRTNHVESKIARFVMHYVALPFFVFYFAILYVYSAKVLLNFSLWPKGEVSWMVIGFSLFGYLFYLSSWKYQAELPLLARARKALPYIILPQTLMLFYALYLRIAQYDLTINRYFVIVFGIYIVIISLYYIFSKKKYITMLPLLLAIVIMSISIGPWGVFSLPEHRQEVRLVKYLTELHILQTDGSIIPLPEGNTNTGAENQVYDIVQYLCNMHECRAIENIFPVQYHEFLEEYELQKDDWDEFSYARNRFPSSWEISSAILSKIQVERYYASGNSSNISFSQKYDVTPEVIDIRGYDVLFDIDSYNSRNVSQTQKNPLYSAVFLQDSLTLSLYGSD